MSRVVFEGSDRVARDAILKPDTHAKLCLEERRLVWEGAARNFSDREAASFPHFKKILDAATKDHNMKCNC